MKIFIGGSSEHTPLMWSIAAFIERQNHEPLPWDSPESFRAGDQISDRLFQISREVDAAIFLFTEDDNVISRKTPSMQPRDNVLVEFGFFASALGKDRTIILRCGKTKHPTDLGGLVYVDRSSGKEYAARESLKAWFDKIEADGSFPPWKRNFLKIVSEGRSLVAPEYKKLRYSAKDVSCLGFGLCSALHEFATDKKETFLRRIVFEGVRARLMFAAPWSECVKQRAVEDGDSLAELQKVLSQCLNNTVHIHERLKAIASGKMTAASREHMGSLEIHVINFCPHVAIDRADDRLFLGFYIAGLRGDNSAVVEVLKCHGGLFKQLDSHFDTMWKESSDTSLLKFNTRRPAMEPFLNTSYIAELLRYCAEHSDGLTTLTGDVIEKRDSI